VLDGVRIDGSSVAVSLSWTGTDDSVGYRVYRQSEGATEPVVLGDPDDRDEVELAGDGGTWRRMRRSFDGPDPDVTRN